MKKIALKLEFYLRGNGKVPSVSFLGTDGYGVPLTPSLSGKTSRELAQQNAAFDEFSAAAHKYCKAISDAGELE